MYESWTEIAVLLRNFLGFIWDLSDVFTVYICSTRVQMQYLKSSIDFTFWRDDFQNRLYLNYSLTTTKNVSKIFYSKLISCLRTGWEHKN